MQRGNANPNQRNYTPDIQHEMDESMDNDETQPIFQSNPIPSLFNIFMNHPSFHMDDKWYNHALYKTYIEPHKRNKGILVTDSINTVRVIDVPVEPAIIDVVNPLEKHIYNSRS